jgi:hypothetical protein
MSRWEPAVPLLSVRGIRYKNAFGGEQQTDFLFKVGGEVLGDD